MVGTGLGGSGNELELIVSGQDNASGVLNSIIGSVTSLEGAVIGLGATLGALAVGGLAKGVSAFADFDEAMTESLAIMGDVSAEMEDDMAAAAREIATTTQFSAQEAAESYFFLASAGLDAAESIESLDEMARFAQAGQFNMAQATDILTDSASALGLEVEEYNELADVMVATNQLANTSVQQLGEALTNKAAAQMRNLNVEVEEGAALLAAFADQGIKGRKAGERLNMILRDLPGAARENAEAFEDLGIEVFDAEGELRNMSAIIADVEAATEGMSAKQRDAALDTLGLNKRVSDSLTTLLGTSEAISDYRTQLEGAGGAAEEVADNQMDTFNAQIGLTKDLVHDIFIGIGENLVPALIEINEVLRTGIERFQEANAATGGMLATVGLITTAVGGFAAAGAGLISILGGTTAIAGAASAAIAALTGPLGIALLAIIALSSAWAQNWGDIQGKTQTAIEFVRDVISQAVDRITEMWNNVMGSELVDETIETFDVVQGRISDFVTWASPFIESFLSFIAPLWKAQFQIVVNTVKFAFDTILTIIEGSIDFWISIIRAGLAIIRGDFGGAWDIIREMFGRQFGRLGDIILDAKDLLVDNFKEIVEGIKQTFRNLWDELVGNSIIPDMLDDIDQMILNWDLVQAFKQKLNGVKDAFEDLYNDVVGNSIIPDMRSDVEVEIVGMAESMTDISERAAEQATRNFERVQDVTDTVRHTMEDFQNMEEMARPDLSSLTAGLEDTVLDLDRSFSTRGPQMPIGDRLPLLDVIEDNPEAFQAAARETMVERKEETVNDIDVEIHAETEEGGKRAGDGFLSELESHLV